MQAILLCTQLLSGQFSHSLSRLWVLSLLGTDYSSQDHRVFVSTLQNEYTAACRHPPPSTNVLREMTPSHAEEYKPLTFFPGKLQTMLARTVPHTTLLFSTLLQSSHRGGARPRHDHTFLRLINKTASGPERTDGWMLRAETED